jgi:hypothetical protein
VSDLPTDADYAAAYAVVRNLTGLGPRPSPVVARPLTEYQDRLAERAAEISRMKAKIDRLRYPEVATEYPGLAGGTVRRRYPLLIFGGTYWRLAQVLAIIGGVFAALSIELLAMTTLILALMAVSAAVGDDMPVSGSGREC